MSVEKEKRILNESEINKYIRTKIREFRKEQKISQEKLATLTGISRVVITNIENGKNDVKAHYLLSISQALDRYLHSFYPTNATFSSKDAKEKF